MESSVKSDAKVQSVSEGGVVQGGPYEGQRYFLAGKGNGPGWWLCNLSDGDGGVV